MALVAAVLLALLLGFIKLSSHGSKIQHEEAIKEGLLSRAALLYSGCVEEYAPNEERYWDEPEVLDVVNGLLQSEPCLKEIRFSSYYLNRIPVMNLLLAMRGAILNEEGSVKDVRVWPVYPDKYNLDGPVQLTREQELALAKILQDELRKNGVSVQLGWRPVSAYEKEKMLRRFPSSIVCDWDGIVSENKIFVGTDVQDTNDVSEDTRQMITKRNMTLIGYYAAFSSEGRKNGTPNHMVIHK